MEPAAPTPPPNEAQDSKQSLADRRAAPRVEMEVEVDFHTDSNFYTGFTEDISEGGLFIATYQLKPIGTMVAFELSLNGQIVRAVGEVRWVRDVREESHGVRPGMGLRFTQLEDADREVITAFLRERTPLFYDAE
jgi:uncharacterized protein (TIGR02266 family)